MWLVRPGPGARHRLRFVESRSRVAWRSEPFPIQSGRNSLMAKAALKRIPDGMHSLTPHLVCAGAADAIEFYKKAFNAGETARMPGPDGKLMHGAVRIGDSTLMLVDENPQSGILGPKALNG